MALMLGYGVSGSTHDFNAFDAAGDVWNGTEFVPWVDADFADYRIAAAVTGTIGGEDRFEADAPAGTVRYELRYRGATAALSYLAWSGELWASQASVDAVAAKTALITSGGVSVVSPVLPGGRINVTHGFDRDGITITEAAVGDWPADDLAADSFSVYFRHDRDDDVEFSTTATLNAVDGDGLRSFTFDVLRTDVPQEGAYTYHVWGSFTTSGLDVEIVKGTFRAERGRIVA